MIKKLLFLLAFLPVTAVAQTVYYTEDFDGSGPGAAAWTVMDLDGLTVSGELPFITNAWTLYDINEGLGSVNNVMLSTSWYDPAGQSNDWLISPQIQLPAEGPIHLLWDAIAFDGDYPDGYKVMLSPNGSTDIADFFQVYSVDAEVDYWKTSSVDLSNFAGTTVRFAFVNDSEDMYVLGVDNIKITNEEAPMSYCSVGTGSAVEAISYVGFAGIVNTTDFFGQSYYNDYSSNPNLIATVNAGDSYDITLNGYTDGYDCNFTVFFDWNQDGDFDDNGERYEAGVINDDEMGVEGVPAITSIAVPGDAVPGVTRMRVIKVYAQYVENACSIDDQTFIGWFGETEDYSVQVNSMSAPAFNNANFKAYPNPVENVMHLSYTTDLSQVEVYNMMGQLVLTQKVNGTQSSVDLSSLTSGAYMMKVQAVDATSTTVKVIRK